MEAKGEGPMRGRKPTPVSLRLVRGNPGRRPIPEVAKVSSEMPQAPAHLSQRAREEWDTIAPQLHEAGLLAKVDRSALAAYCQAYGRWVEAEVALKTHGTLVKSPSGFPMVSPYLTVANKAMEQMTKMLIEFGMSPSSRSRVTVEKPVKQSAVSRFLPVAARRG